MTSNLASLSKLLDEAGLTASVRPERLAAPAFLDGTYRAALIALAIVTLGRRSEGAVFLNSTVLRFATFLASRPHLLSDFETWCSARAGRTQDFESWASLPRGYLSDDLHDSLVTFLSAIGELRLSGTTVGFDPDHDGLLKDLWAEIGRVGLFMPERQVLSHLKRLHLSQSMLVAA